MIYLDTSALVKLLVAEQESAALASWLGQHPGMWLTSTITEVELPLAAGRYKLAPDAADHLLERMSLVEMAAEIRRSAASYGSLGLRALDAIHVASAHSIQSETLTVPVVTYDHRMAAACRALDLDVISPGSLRPAPIA